MKRIQLIIFILAVMLPGLMSAEISEENLRQLDTLKSAFENYEHARKVRVEMVDSIKHMRRYMPNSRRRILLGEQLGRMFIKHNIDSTLTYWNLAYNEARELGEDSCALSLIMQVYAAMPQSGMDIEAMAGHSRIDSSTIAGDLKKQYWLTLSELNYNIQRHYPPGLLKTNYRRRTRAALDSLAVFYPADSPVSGYIRALIYDLGGEPNMAAATFAEILPRLRNRPELYDTALEHLANYYAGRPAYRQQYLNYQLCRVTERLLLGISDPEAMAVLGKLLYDEGEKRIGEALITEALNTSDAALGPFREFDRSKYSEYISTHDRQKRAWWWVVIGVLAGICAGAAIVILAQRRRISTLSDKAMILKSDLDTDRLEKKQVGGGIMELVFLCYEQLREYNIFVARKLKTGQVKDLYNDITDGRYLRSLNEKFFEAFDQRFLEYFPNFVEDLNLLLEKDRSMALLAGQRMSPELRIAAFLRLGLTDSYRLSQLMGLSINTIYTYRNRLKGRAKDRENFEKQLYDIRYNG